MDDKAVFDVYDDLTRQLSRLADQQVQLTHSVDAMRFALGAVIAAVACVSTFHLLNTYVSPIVKKWRQRRYERWLKRRHEDSRLRMGTSREERERRYQEWARNYSKRRFNDHSQLPVNIPPGMKIHPRPLPEEHIVRDLDEPQDPLAELAELIGKRDWDRGSRY